MPKGSRTPREKKVYSPLSNPATDQPSQSQGARVQNRDGPREQQEDALRQTTTVLASSFELGRASQPCGGQKHQPASGEPPSPAMTTSDVHGRSCSSSIASTSSRAGTQPQHLGLQDNLILVRYMTLGQDEPLQFEANIAIQGGWVRDGENMVDRRVKEGGWPSISGSGVSGNATESSVTLGREAMEDEMPEEQGIDG